MEATFHNHQKTILCVDDNKHMLTAMRRVLRPLHHRVILTNKPQRALTLAAQMQPDLIFLDVRMPGMDGFKVLNDLRAGAFEETPVVMVTATQDFVTGYNAGCTFFVTKPCRTTYVRDLVRYLIGDLCPAERYTLAQRL